MLRHGLGTGLTTGLRTRFWSGAIALAVAVTASVVAGLGPGVAGARVAVAAVSVTSRATAVQRSIPAETTQLVVGLANDWSSTRATLTRFERKSGGSWSRVGPAIAARLGPTGLAWGRGLVDVTQLAATAAGTAPEKVEGDKRAPAGAFALDTVYAYDAAWAKRTAMPFINVGPRDLFVEDPTSALYNTHVRLDHLPGTAWEKEQQMEQGDEAHRLKVFVGHNTNPPVPGRGSAIYLHVWRRDGASPTAGCTAMSFDSLRAIVGWLQPTANPVFVLLPKGAYTSIASAWDLPPIGNR